MSSARSVMRWLVMTGALVTAASVDAQQAAPRAPVSAPKAAPTPAAEQPTLGRFFYTPVQRAALDEARRRPTVAAQMEKPKLPPPPEYVTLNGVVRHSDGTTVVWLNNKPVRSGQTDEGLQVAPVKGAPAAGNVTVRVPQTGRIVDLKVGQQVEITSGQVQEAYRLPRRAQSVPDTPSTTALTEPPAPRRASRDRDSARDLDVPYPFEPPANRPSSQGGEARR